MEIMMDIFAFIGALVVISLIGAFIFAFFAKEPFGGCPPCNGNCNQGRDCPARK